jgi:hypothetical protein
MQAEGAGSVASLEFTSYHEIRCTQLVEAMGAASQLHHNVSLHGIHKAFERKQHAQSLLQGLPNNVLCGERTLLNKS